MENYVDLRRSMDWHNELNIAGNEKHEYKEKSMERHMLW